MNAIYATLVLIWTMQGSLATAAVPDAPDAGLDQRPGAALPNGVHLTREDGAEVSFAAILHTGRPLLLTFVYFGCPNLCNLFLRDLMKSLKPLSQVISRDYDLVIVSIDPREGPTLAAQDQRTLLGAYGRPEVASGLHVLTGRADQIGQLASAAGVRFAYDAEEEQYRHPSVLISVTPDGRVSRYLLGLSLKPRDIQLALVEAGAGRLASPEERLLSNFLLFCYHYDSRAGRYNIAANNIVRAGTLAAAALFFSFMFCLRRPRRKEAA